MIRSGCFSNLPTNELKKPPSKLAFDDLTAPFIGAFLDHIQSDRHNGTRTRNLRLTAIRSFFHYAAFQEPSRSAQIQRVLAIPNKRQDRPLIDFLTHPEIKALLAAPDKTTWAGRRDQALLVLAIQTGLRLSELIGIRRRDIVLTSGAHVRCYGKGRKERCTPLTKQTVAIMKAWLEERAGSGRRCRFPQCSRHSTQSRWCSVPSCQTCGNGSKNMPFIKNQTGVASRPSTYCGHGTPSGRGQTIPSSPFGLVTNLLKPP